MYYTLNNKKTHLIIKFEPRITILVELNYFERDNVKLFLEYNIFDSVTPLNVKSEYHPYKTLFQG